MNKISYEMEIWGGVNEENSNKPCEIRVYSDQEGRNILRDWCNINFGFCCWYPLNNESHKRALMELCTIFQFYYPEDALAFKLMWQG